jgi:hypothetical protein
MTAARTYFIDRLRVVLTVLVILHHTAITYGGSGGWFYREVHDGSTPTSLLLTVFCAVNQSFFMGMLFLLAPGCKASRHRWLETRERRQARRRLRRAGAACRVAGTPGTLGRLGGQGHPAGAVALAQPAPQPWYEGTGAAAAGASLSRACW